MAKNGNSLPTPDQLIDHLLDSCMSFLKSLSAAEKGHGRRNIDLVARVAAYKVATYAAEASLAADLATNPALSDSTRLRAAMSSQKMVEHIVDRLKPEADKIGEELVQEMRLARGCKS